MASKQLQQNSSAGGSGGGEGVRQRVNRCMIKLSDRDTEAMAASELDAIAKSLTADNISPFLSAIADARPTDKTPLRRHSLRLISLLSHSHPAATVAPHFPRMLAAALRRLRDPDSSVRSASVDAVRSMAAAHPPAVATVLFRPLADALLHEQDQCAQTAAALSLAAAINAATATNGGGARDQNLAQNLQRLLPRVVKLLRSNSFKAKPALLSLLGSAAGAGGAGTPALIALLVPCLVEYLACQDWAARKAGAEALSILAVTEKDLLVGFRSSCISSFESKRFDKVKIVRDSMNRMLDAWKDIPESQESDCNGVTAKQSQPNLLLRDTTNDEQYPTASVGCSSVKSSSPLAASKSKFATSRSPPPVASPIPAPRNKTISIRNKMSSPPLVCMTFQKPSTWRAKIAVGDTQIKDMNEETIHNFQVQETTNGNIKSRLEARRMLFEINDKDNGNKSDGLKSALRVVSLQGDSKPEISVRDEIVVDELNGGQKDGNLSLIRMQLVQIENQQSTLLDLLQKFIGTSQDGIRSLETRVHGLEMAMDDISRDIATSYGRIYDDLSANTCCRLPVAELLSSKFWRRTDARYSSWFSASDLDNLTEKESRGPRRWDKQSLGVHGGFIINPLAEFNPRSRGSSDITSKKFAKREIHGKGFTHNQEGKKQNSITEYIRSG